MTEAASLAGEYLVFRLGGEYYGLNILLAQEIRSYEQPSHIDGAPAFLRGVFNLRGVTIPIIDLRIVAGCESSLGPLTVVVVLNLSGRIIGVVVDGVSEVLDITADQVRLVDGHPHPDTLTHIMATVDTGEQRLALVDIFGLMESLHLATQGAL